MNSMDSPTDPQKAEKLCLESADEGNLFASGMKHFHGWKTPIDRMKAMLTFTELVEDDRKGEKEETSYCYIYLAKIFYEEKGVSKNINKVVEYYNKSIEMNNIFAITFFGALLFRGYIVKQDVEKAFNLFTKGIELGSSYCMYIISRIYNGEGGGQIIKKDSNKALEMLKRAVDLNHPLAINCLASYYLTGTNGVQKDLKEAFNLLSRASDLNVPDAIYNLGNMYFHGEQGFLKKDVQKAVSYFRRAAELGNAKGMFNLGIAYRNGQGAEKDAKKAIEWYEKAAALNLPIALYNLGVIYSEGTDVKKDSKKGFEYLKKAANLGHDLSKQYIKDHF